MTNKGIGCGALIVAVAAVYLLGSPKRPAAPERTPREIEADLLRHAKAAAPLYPLLPSHEPRLPEGWLIEKVTEAEFGLFVEVLAPHTFLPARAHSLDMTLGSVACPPDSDPIWKLLTVDQTVAIGASASGQRAAAIDCSKFNAAEDERRSSEAEEDRISKKEEAAEKAMEKERVRAWRASLPR